MMALCSLTSCELVNPFQNFCSGDIWVGTVGFLAVTILSLSADMVCSVGYADAAGCDVAGSCCCGDLFLFREFPVRQRQKK